MHNQNFEKLGEAEDKHPVESNTIGKYLMFKKSRRE